MWLVMSCAVTAVPPPSNASAAAHDDLAACAEGAGEAIGACSRLLAPHPKDAAACNDRGVEVLRQALR